ncbi:cellulose biosynthesis protein BcsS [Bradyrhizobium arachidis]|uniref:cellulose biosynthesis protein BcsS n=1 Tax=Bradyrhizobium arachidis TaxID=858423 RepID=UPI0021624781|nr:cellulose biosynthesis protein BcsS [Bradyrhizobium arachidis]UVO27046.1 cellulose biosynthesis protein BcsS [Bradyrhizobium arachidis]
MKLLKGFTSVLMVGLAGVAVAEEPPRLSVQSTSDFSSYGAFYTDLTALHSPFGNLWEPGWRVEGIASARRYSFVDADQKRVGLDTTLDVLAGYQFAPHGWSWLVAAGMTAVNSHLYAAPGLPRSDAQLYGLKVLTSLYGKPTDQTMVYVQAHYNTASEFYYAQGKTGIAIAPNIFVGPEAAYSGGWTYNQVRFGGHITGFTVLGMNTGVSLGFVRDSNYGKGVYGGLNFQVNF